VVTTRISPDDFESWRETVAIRFDHAKPESAVR